MWCNLDPCGLICAGITYFLVAYSQYAVTVCVLGQWLGLGSLFGALHAVAFNTLACLAYASHVRAMLTDPGAVSCRALVRGRVGKGGGWEWEWGAGEACFFGDGDGFGVRREESGW